LFELNRLGLPDIPAISAYDLSLIDADGIQPEAFSGESRDISGQFFKKILSYSAAVFPQGNAAEGACSISFAISHLRRIARLQGHHLVRGAASVRE
jgi:hypothetical protein